MPRKGVPLSEWAEALASGEIELDEKLVKKGFDSSYGRMLVADWHPSKNGDLTPQTVTAGTHKKVWWRHADSSCVVPGGHEWEVAGSARARLGSGCPVCAGKAVVAGVNDMATTHPELVADWHPSKNGDLTPQTVMAGTGKKVWWKHSDSSCVVPGGHEWETTGNARVSNGSGCPVCAGKAVVTGVNDMATTHPELAADWHPSKNGDLTPQAVVAGTEKKVWWRHADPSCIVPGGHEWGATGAARARLGSGCPACSGNAVVTGVNDMATTHPELAADWHPSKNGDLTPQTVGAGTDKKVWWKHSDSSCVVPGGHEWETEGWNRVKGNGCPACSGNAVVAGANDMATTHPELAADWHPTKNGDLTPQTVSAGTSKKVWWRHADPSCVVPGGHEWETNGSNRVNGNGCPACNRGWGLDAVRKFIITMVEYGHIGSLSQAEMYTLAQQNGLLNSQRVGDAITSLASGSSINAFAGDQLKTISEESGLSVHDLTNDMSDLDIAQANPEAFADFVLADVDGATFDDPEAGDDTLADTADMAAVMNGDVQASAELSAAVLPGEAVEQALRSADVLFATVDEQMVDYFIAARKHELWKQAYKDPEAALAAAEAFRG
jgi:hypothetical protein